MAIFGPKPWVIPFGKMVRWPVRDITIFFFLPKLSRDNSNLSRDKLKLSRDKMKSYRAINKKIIAR